MYAARPALIRSAARRFAALFAFAGLSLTSAHPTRAQSPAKTWVEKPTVSAPVAGQKRLALILGNTHYGGAHELKNPENDAQSIALALGKVGFTSTVVLDGSRDQMRDAVHDFADRIRAAGDSSVALIYYSGHGMQVGGENYLVPIGFKMPAHAGDIGDYALSAQKALDEMQAAHARVNIAILDACRDNPFDNSKSLGGGKGLAKLETQGIFIAYATAAGKTADDNRASGNGLYTASLLKNLRTPGLTLAAVFSRTKKAVYEASDHKQFPYVYDGLIDADEFCLVPGVVTPSAVTPAVVVAATPAVDSAASRPFSPPLTLAAYKAQMITIPAGEFIMGSDRDKNAGPIHKVHLSAYKIGKTDVTVAMYSEFCTATNRAMPPAPDFDARWSKKDHPIVNVSWDDAMAYCNWAGFTLPSEAQWEKAARGASGLKYPWGNDFDTKKLWCSIEVVGDASGTRAVGDFPSGSSPYGCLDMTGNVWQWCVDWYDADFYASHGGQENNPVNNVASDLHPLRGGGWSDVNAIIFHCAERGGIAPSFRNNNAGFRAVAASSVVSSAVSDQFMPALTLADYKAQMVTIPAGAFTMGSDTSNFKDEKPTHKVYLSAYRIGKTAVTVGMYEEFCLATKRAMPSSQGFNADWSKKDHPIVNVSWDDAVAYCKWAGLSLPTEAQWEKAARGSDGRDFPWGKDFDRKKLWCSIVNWGDAGGTQAVGGFPSGASPYGCLDMSGNVFQWCMDWYDEDFYKKWRGSESNPVNDSPSDGRVLRGGSWYFADEHLFRCATRNRYVQSDRNGGHGFRAVERFNVRDKIGTTNGTN